MLAETCACARQVGTGLKYNRDGARDALKKNNNNQTYNFLESSCK